MAGMVWALMYLALRNFGTFVGGMALGFVLCGPSMADGMVRERPLAPYASWTGFYIGVGIGAQWDKDIWRTGLIGDPLGPNDGFTPRHSFDQLRAQPEIFGGYNLQLGKTVIGLEGGILPGTATKSTVGLIPGTVVLGPPIVPGDQATVSHNWEAYLRARAGILLTPSTLAYVAGGYAVRQIEIGASCGNLLTFSSNWCLFGPRTETVNQTVNGYTVGAGLETLIGKHIAFRLDYRFSDFGKVSHTFFAADPTDQLQMKLDNQSHAVIAGLAYRF